jgi:hypothetical protein
MDDARAELDVDATVGCSHRGGLPAGTLLALALVGADFDRYVTWVEAAALTPCDRGV